MALSKRVVVLGNRPTKVKAVHDIALSDRSPVGARSDPHFADYFHTLCGELDIQTRSNTVARAA